MKDPFPPRYLRCDVAVCQGAVCGPPHLVSAPTPPSLAADRQRWRCIQILAESGQWWLRPAASKHPSRKDLTAIDIAAKMGTLGRNSTLGRRPWIEAVSGWVYQNAMRNNLHLHYPPPSLHRKYLDCQVNGQCGVWKVMLCHARIPPKTKSPSLTSNAHTSHRGNRSEQTLRCRQLVPWLWRTTDGEILIKQTGLRPHAFPSTARKHRKQTTVRALESATAAK